MEHVLIYAGIAILFPVVALGARALYLWTRRRGLVGQLARARMCMVAEISRPHELVAIQGRARATSLVRAPVSGAQVIAYRVRIATVMNAGSERSEAYEVTDVGRMEAFMVEDETGAALVRPGEGQVMLLARPHPVPQPHLAVALTSGVFEKQLLVEGGISTSDIVSARRVVCTEHLLLPDSPVTVCGRAEVAVDATGAGGSYRQAPTRVAISPPAGEPLLVADCDSEVLKATIGERLG